MPFKSRFEEDEECGQPCRRIAEMIEFLGTEPMLAFHTGDLPDDLHPIARQPLACLTFGKVAETSPGVITFSDYHQVPSTFRTGRPGFVRLMNGMGDVMKDVKIGDDIPSQIRFSGRIQHGWQLSGYISINCHHCRVRLN